MNTATPAHPFERACWAGTALLALALLQSIYRVPIGALPLTLVTGLGVLAAFRPWPALLAVAGVGPLAYLALRLSGPSYDARLDEIVVLAFIGGAAAHLAVRPARGALPTAFRWSSWLLFATALASAAVVFAGIAATDPSAAVWRHGWRMVSSEYLQGPHPLFPAMLLIEGVLLSLLCAEIAARDPRPRATVVVAAMVAAAAALGVLTMVRLVSIAVARDDPWTAIVALIVQFRVSVVHPDLNAAGSYFAMMMCAAVGLARWKGIVVAVVPLIGLALWTSGSRAALLALLMVGVVAVLRHRGVRADRRIAAGGAAAFVLFAIVAVAWYPEGRNENLKAAALFRIQIARAALYAVADAPLFGIGGGRFYDESMRYVAASRHADTPLHVGANENAHNNFLQIAAELGIIGLGLFLTMVVSGLGRPSEPAGEDRLRWWAAAGLVLYLATCMVGHPLLVPGSAYPFWLLLGVSAGAWGAVPGSSGRQRLAAAALAAFVLVSLPFRAVGAVRSANLEHVGVGVSMWQRDERGARFRWAGGRSTIYVPADAAAVRIPLRHGGQGPEVIEVRIFIEGREANRVLVEPGDEWNVVRLLITHRTDMKFIDVELVATAPGSPLPLAVEPTSGSGALMIGRAEPEGIRY